MRVPFPRKYLAILDDGRSAFRNVKPGECLFVAQIKTIEAAEGTRHAYRANVFVATPKTEWVEGRLRNVEGPPNRFIRQPEWRIQ